MSEPRPSSSAGLYTHVTTAFASRIPVFNRVVRRRTNLDSDKSRPETPQSRTRSSSALSTSSLDSLATTAVASGASTPYLVPHIAGLSRVDPVPSISQPRSLQGKQETKCSIDCDTARAGVSLATAALNRLNINTSDSTARDMYVDAVKYMVCSLPSDLSETEKMNLCPTSTTTNSLSLSPHTNHNPPSYYSNPSQSRTAAAIRTASSHIVTLTLSTLFSLFLLGIPIFALIFTRVLHYERRYKLSEKAIESARTTVGATGASLVRIGQSRSGAYFLATVLWVVQCVLEGVGDGVRRAEGQVVGRFPVAA